MDISKLAETIRHGGYSWTNERELQEQIERQLRRCRISHQREARKTPGERPDFLAGTTAIEVKIAGTRSALLRQLQRYALLDEVTEILLVTDKMRLSANLPETLGGKPLRTVTLIRL